MDDTALWVLLGLTRERRNQSRTRLPAQERQRHFQMDGQARSNVLSHHQIVCAAEDSAGSYEYFSRDVLLALVFISRLSF